MLYTQEHYDLIAQFEKDYNIKPEWATKEPKELWPKGYIYAHGETNTQFIAYRFGYALRQMLPKTKTVV